MIRVWRLYRAACVGLVSLALLLCLGFLIVAGMAALWTKPVASETSPDGRYQIRVFSAGQGSIPPDYRAGVSFWLHDMSGAPFGHDKLVAEAALADGWSLRWQGPREVTIEAGRLSWFETSVKQARGVNVQVRIATRPAAEAECIGQSFSNAIDGVVCFDKLLETAGASAR